MSVMYPKVSVLIPAYNSEKFIIDCVRSVLNQTYKNIEIIVVDDGSTDKTYDFLAKFIVEKSLSSVNLIRQQNLGVSVTRNTALDYASGDYVFYLDSDDEIGDSKSIEYLVSKAQQDHAEIVLGAFKSIFNNRESINTFLYSSKEEYMENVILDKCPCSMCGKLIKKTLFLTNGLRFIKGLDFGEDYVITLQLSSVAKRISFIDDVVYAYKRRLNNSLSNVSGDVLYQSYLEINSCLMRYFYGQPRILNLLKIRAKLIIIKHLEDVGKLKEVESLYSDISTNVNLSILDRFILFLSRIHAFRLILFMQRVNRLRHKIRVLIH